MNDTSIKLPTWVYIIGIIPVIWMALLFAPYLTGGIIDFIDGFSKIMNNPFKISICDNSLKTIVIFIVIYIMGLCFYFSTRKNYRKGAVFLSSW